MTGTRGARHTSGNGSPVRSWAVALLITGGSTGAVAQASPAAADPCAAADGPIVAIEAITPLGDVKLSDGRLGRFADLDLGADAVSAGRWPDHLSAVRAVLVGRPARIDEGGAFPDRWGRRPLRASPAEGTVPAGASAHRLLVERGLARVFPANEQEACAMSLLDAEDAARRQGLGLWREPAARLLGAAETAAIRAMTGRFAIIQGRIVSVGERPRRVYLNFGRDFQRDFVATLSPKTARLLEKAGIAPSSLRGKTVRVRGMVAARRAPAIEITGPAQIEVVR